MDRSSFHCHIGRPFCSSTLLPRRESGLSFVVGFPPLCKRCDPLAFIVAVLSIIASSLHISACTAGKGQWDRGVDQRDAHCLQPCFQRYGYYSGTVVDLESVASQAASTSLEHTILPHFQRRAACNIVAVCRPSLTVASVPRVFSATFSSHSS